jgi:alkylation response protein AidB-like acyl-CoA dehydrogenase
MANNFMVNERDVRFVMFEHLKLEELCRHEPFTGFSKEDFSMVLNEAVKFTRNELAPLHEVSDREGVRFEDGRVSLPEAFHPAYQKFCDGGWIAVARSPEYGGGGMPTVIRMMALELFEAGCVAFMIYPGLTHGVGHLVESFGDDDMKALYTERLYTGVWSGTMSLTEPQAGSHLGDIKTLAEPYEGNVYKLRGTKQFISAGEHDLTPNIIHMVLARIKGAPEGVRGISMFLVPKVRVNPDGSLGDPNDVQCIAVEHKMGLHASATCQLAFGENDDCLGWLVGEPNRGLIYMFQLMNEARISVGMQALGGASCAYEQAVAYCKERVQGADVMDRKGPSVPIIRHPDVRRMLMSMKSTVEGLRALLYLSGMYYDLARVHPEEKERERYANLLEILTPICKAYGSDRGYDVLELAFRCLGGYGYTRDYPIEQFMRDSKVTVIYEGTNGIQALDLLGRKVFMKEGAAFDALIEEVDKFITRAEGMKELSDETALLKKAKQELKDTTDFLKPLRAEDPYYFTMVPCPYLDSTGDIVLSWLLLEQAAIALESLKDDTQDQDFFQTKVKTARFFARKNLPMAITRLQTLKTKDHSALEIEEKDF